MIRPTLMAILLTSPLLFDCGVALRGVQNSVSAVGNSRLFNTGRRGALSEVEKDWAKIAWRYFENNYNPQTGLVNSVDRYPSTSMWHLADYIVAMIAAHEFELIDRDEFDERLSILLHFLNNMALFEDRLPNKLYHTINGTMVNFNNEPEEVGWSAIDIGRMLIWLKIIRDRYPLYSEYVDKIVLRWRFCDVIDRCGKLYGGVKVQDRVELFQEGRLGYEEYAALGFQAWGFDTKQASRLHPYKTINIYGIELPHDERDPRENSTYAPLVTLPYTLWGMEFEWQSIRKDNRPELHISELAKKLYRVQERRWQKEKIFTARTDHQLREAPYFVYDAIFVDGYAWNTISDAGDYFPNAALVSTRAVFGMWGLWKTPYTEKLMRLTDVIFDQERGWFEGRFEYSGGHEESITCTTNSVVLETLLFKKKGRLYKPDRGDGYYLTFLQNEFNHVGDCFPPERADCHTEVN